MKPIRKQSTIFKMLIAILMLIIPGIAMANEGQKILGIVNDIVVGYGLLILLFLIFPFLVIIPNSRWRFSVFTLINISAIIFLVLNFELDDFEIFNGYGIVIFLLVINSLYAWRHFKKPKITYEQEEIKNNNPPE